MLLKILRILNHLSELGDLLDFSPNELPSLPCIEMFLKFLCDHACNLGLKDFLSKASIKELQVF